MNYCKIGKNFIKLKDATEHYNEIMTFLYAERDYKYLELFIGTFEYDDWKSKLYCILDVDNKTPDIYFIEENLERNTKSKYYRLTDLAYGWSFEEAIININFDITKNFYDLLTTRDRYVFDSIIDEVHSHFW